MESSDKRPRLSRFGAAIGFLFSDHAGSVEVSLAPLEIKRILEAWADWELADANSSSETLRALHFLMEKTYEKAPRLIVEAPFASCGRAAITPDFAFLKAQRSHSAGEKDEEA